MSYVTPAFEELQGRNRERFAMVALDDFNVLDGIAKAAAEVDAAYPDEFGDEVWDDPPEYRWKRAMHALHAALRGK